MEVPDERDLVGGGVVLRGPPVGDLCAGEPLAGPGDEAFPMLGNLAGSWREMLSGDDEQPLPVAVWGGAH
jgi:hypothetical protein